MCGVGSQPTFSTSSWIVSRDSPTRASIRPPQQQLLAEDGGLQHLALGVEDALVAVPPLSVAGQARRAVRDPPVQAERLRRLRRVVVLLGRVLGHEQRVVETAGRQEAAAEVAEEAQALRLVEPRSGEAGRRQPRERPSRRARTGRCRSPVDDDVELEARAGSELEQADSALGPVAERDQPNARTCSSRPTRRDSSARVRLWPWSSGIVARVQPPI